MINGQHTWLKWSIIAPQILSKFLSCSEYISMHYVHLSLSSAPLFVTSHLWPCCIMLLCVHISSLPLPSLWVYCFGNMRVVPSKEWSVNGNDRCKKLHPSVVTQRNHDAHLKYAWVNIFILPLLWLNTPTAQDHKTYNFTYYITLYLNSLCLKYK